MRDHRKLQAFTLADDLAMAVFHATKTFPREEIYGMTSQMRRAAVSVASNIVEGCARSTELEYLRFLDIAYGSAKELEYQISLAQRMEYLSPADATKLADASAATARTLNALINALRNPKPKA